MRTMDLRTVQQFIAVVEEGSLRAAAQRSGVTQPALTKLVRRLEDEVGARLLHRSAMGTRLTPAGETFLRHARALRALHLEALSEIRALAGGKVGRLRIGAGPAWHRAILPAAIGAFHATHPGVRLDVRFGSDRTLVDLLRDGRVELVLAAMPETPEQPDLAYRPLVRDGYEVIAHRGHALAAREAVPLGELLTWPWVASGPGTLIRARLEASFRSAGLPPPEPVVETEITELRLALLLDGRHLSINVGASPDPGEPSRLVALDIAATLGVRVAGVITWRSTEPGPMTRAFVEALERICAAPPIDGRG
jgi:DNA-binding transcriptional LysR family regulator